MTRRQSRFKPVGHAFLRGALRGMLARGHAQARVPALTVQRAGEPERGRGARGPHEIPAAGWRDIAWRTYEQIVIDRVMAVAGGVTFYVLLGIFPAITAFVSIYGLFADRAAVAGHLTLIADVVPDGGMDVIGEQMQRIADQPGQSLGFGFLAGLAIALWSANQGMKAIFDALNVAYGETEKRGFLALNLASLSFTVCAIAFLLAAIGLVVVMPAAFSFVGVDPAREAWLSLLRWPTMLLVLVAGLAVLYRFGPSRRRAKWRWLSAGSLVAAVVWLAASIGFSWYVANFGSYNETYGSLGAVIGFMMWIWVSSVIVLVGAELNAEIEHQTALDTTVGADRPIGLRGARVADTVGARLED